MTTENETKVTENSTETAIEEKVEEVTENEEVTSEESAENKEETPEEKVEEVPENEEEVTSEESAENEEEVSEEKVEEVPENEETVPEEPSENEETFPEEPIKEFVEEELSVPPVVKPEKTPQDEFISEFAPAPIKIPNYNKEKEMRKRVKMKEKNKKARSKKSRRRRKLIKRILVVVRNVVLFMLLLVLATATVSTLFVKTNTSEYSVKKAIRDAAPETFIIGEMDTPKKINLRESSKKTSVADILRDNTMRDVVTYAEIQNEVMRSSYPDFVAGVAHKIINYYVYDTEYNGVKKEELEEAILDNASRIKTATARDYGETASAELAAYIMESDEIKSLSPAKIAKQEASQSTHITSMLFSTMSLVCFVIALLLIMIVTVMFCKGYAYKLIGWAAVVSGVICGVLGFLFKPRFVPEGEFIRSVVEAIEKSLDQSALVFGGVTILIGILIMLVGSALKDDGEEDEDEEYIEEVEQTSTEQ